MATVCVSHKEDVDGLSAAALVKAASGASKVVLVDYSKMIQKLEKVVSGKKYKQIIICDLGLSKKNEQEFVALLEAASEGGAEVIYIDHHDLGKELGASIRKTGTHLIHTTAECTSIQVYQHFKKELPPESAFLAAMGALTDYMEDRPIASSIVPRFDRQFLMLEATSLSYMISSNQGDDEFLCKAVDVLAKMKYPHDIKGGFEMAEKYAKKVANAVQEIGSSIEKLDNLAYAPSTVELAASMVVNFVLGTSEKPVALVYKLKKDVDSYVLSIRGASNCKVHLGRLVNEIATSVGGSGGGHERASGAVVPKSKLKEFLSSLDKQLAGS